MDKINILAIGAHPDDIEIGCGGTIIKYADQGHSVSLLIMTGGGQGGNAETRMREQEHSRQIMGMEKVFWGGYEDTQLQVNQELVNKIEAVVKEVNPHFIFCHFPDDTHQDHRHLSLATQSAARNLRNVLFYEGPTTWGFSPQVFVNISDTLDRKIDALLAHRSQIDKTNIEDLSIVQIAHASANFRGIQGRVKAAEGFVPLRLFINVNPKGECSI
ncbi:MAG: PIG-L deacetylase family protein [Pseudomonadota bacterium]